jgi:hypothetical protein
MKALVVPGRVQNDPRPRRPGRCFAGRKLRIKAGELGSSPLAKAREATDQAMSGAVEPAQVGS